MLQTKKIIAVIEIRWVGHHPSWFNIFCKKIIKQSHKVYAFCPEPEKAKNNFVKNKIPPELLKNIQFFKIEDKSLKHRILRKIPAIRNEITLKNIKSDFEKTLTKEKLPKPDHIFFSCLASASFILPSRINKLFPYKWSAVFINCSFIRISKLQCLIQYRTIKPLNMLTSKNCESIIIIEEDMLGKINKLLPNKKIYLSPDFADDTPPNNNYHLIEKINKFSKNREIIGMLGAIGKQKGLIEFFQTVQISTNPNYCFVCIGKLFINEFNKKEQKFIDSILQKYKNILFTDFNFLPTDAEYNAVLNTFDIFVLPFKNFERSSNSPAKASMFKKPIIISGKGCTAERIKKYKLGINIDDNKPEKIYNSIEQIFKQKVAKNAHFSQYLKDHSITKIDNIFSKIF